jgi:hypothetical protein
MENESLERRGDSPGIKRETVSFLIYSSIYAKLVYPFYDAVKERGRRAHFPTQFPIRSGTAGFSGFTSGSRSKSSEDRERGDGASSASSITPAVSIGGVLSPKTVEFVACTEQRLYLRIENEGKKRKEHTKKRPSHSRSPFFLTPSAFCSSWPLVSVFYGDSLYL